MDGTSNSKPLVVDLDGTLVQTDMLVEGLLSGLFGRPLATMKALLGLRHGRAALKRAIATIDMFEIASMPWREPLVSYLEAEKRSGRELHLVTAADHAIAEQVARHLALFETAEGSRDGVNLKGERKLEHLKARFPDGFAYAGNSRADLPIWRAADSIILAGANNATRAAAHRLGRPIEAEFRQDRNDITVWLRAARIHQWSKNLLIFVPLVLAHAYTSGEAVLNAVFGFLVFGLIASATYLINDMTDLAADRGHPTKRKRPLACGEIPLVDAVVAGSLAIVVGLALAAMLNGPFFFCVLIYLVLTLLYSFHFKRVAMLDVFIIACLFTLRVVAGVALVGVALSGWLLAFSMFFFFSLSLAKRYNELVRRDTVASATIPGRGYRAGDGPLVLAFGVANGTAAVLVMLIYLVNEAFPLAVYARPEWLWGIPPIVMLWVIRVWLMAHRGDLGDDPILFAVRDPASLTLACIIAAEFVVALR